MMLKRMLLVALVLALVVGVVSSLGLASSGKTPSGRSAPAHEMRERPTQQQLVTWIGNCSNLRCVKKFVKWMYNCELITDETQYGGYEYGGLDDGTTTTGLDFTNLITDPVDNPSLGWYC